MTNREKYKDELIEALKNAEFYKFYDRNIRPFYDTNQCYSTEEFKSAILTILWLDEECVEPVEPEVDWSKVAIDTPILVKEADADPWLKRYFAQYKGGRIYAWLNGATSWSVEDEYSWTCWNYAKLAEEE